MLKKALKDNILTIGSWVTIGHPSVVEIMASAGFDWLTIDMEHTTISFETAQVLITVIQANSMKALVRVGHNDELIIKKVMDAGADGVIVPMVKTAEDASKAVSYVKYPPAGKRGVGLYRAQKYGTDFEGYKKWVEEESVVIAQIEHIDAVKNIESIINVEGIDGILVGPYDLSASMGYPGQYDRNDVKEAISIVDEAAKKYNMPMGFHVINSDSSFLQEKIDKGYTLLAFSLDFFFLGDKAREEMAKIKRGAK